MPITQKDFIEIEFTGRTKEGNIFDSNIKEDLEKANLNVVAKPFIFSLSQGMFLKGIEDFLIGKELGRYEIVLSPENAFGKRDSNKIRMVPINVFREKQVNPVPGAIFEFDGMPAKILTVSGGRVIVDFNNLLAGKEITYKINVLRKVEDKSEQIKSFNEFLFKQDFKFEIKDKKLSLEVEKKFSKIIEMFKDKYKEIFELELEIKEI